jgi:hypothetical protein
LDVFLGALGRDAVGCSGADIGDEDRVAGARNGVEYLCPGCHTPFSALDNRIREQQA